MKKTYFLFVSLFFFVVPVRAQSVFSDVPDNHWAAQAVKKLAEAGIIEGRPSSGAAVASTREARAPEIRVPRNAVSMPKTSAPKARATKRIVAHKNAGTQKSPTSTRSVATRKQG